MNKEENDKLVYKCMTISSFVLVLVLVIVSLIQIRWIHELRAKHDLEQSSENAYGKSGWFSVIVDDGPGTIIPCYFDYQMVFRPDGLIGWDNGYRGKYGSGGGLDPIRLKHSRKTTFLDGFDYEKNIHTN